MKTKEEIEQRLIENKQERKQLKQQLKDLSSLEVGRWYWAECLGVENYLILLEDLVGLKAICYITERSGSFIEGGSFSSTQRPATDKEVEEALIKEAKKRGFEEGIRFNNAVKDSVWEDSSGVVSAIYSNDWGLFTNNQYIFCKGKWAEIIKPKTVNLNGDYTEVQLKDVLNSQFNK